MSDLAIGALIPITRSARELSFPLTNFSICFNISTLHIIKMDICNVDSFSTQNRRGSL